MGNNYMIENTTKKLNPMVQERMSKYKLGHKTAQWRKQKLSWMLKNELTKRREKCCPRREEGNSFNKSRKIEMTMVHEQNMIFFGEPLNTLLLKGKTNV